jgi:hypothetical protein
MIVTLATSQNWKKKTLLKHSSSVFFFFFAPQFCDVAQAEIIHKKI